MSELTLEGEHFEGHIATGCGGTSISATWGEENHVSIRLRSRWMGDAEPMEIELICTHHPRGTHYGVLTLDRAQDREGRELALPPSDGVLLFEYVRVPPQDVEDSGSDTMESAGHWTSPFRLLIWLHRDSFYDDGTQLSREEYDDPPETFAATARALKWFEAPWKLG